MNNLKIDSSLDRLRTINRSVAQDLLMHAMMVKSFLSICGELTDVMKLNVHLEITTHIIMLKLSRITMQSNYVWIAMST